MKFEHIIKKLPYSTPFLFVDELDHIDEYGVTGSYTFNENSDFYKGHFKDNPVTPGVILTECCAQIGLVCLGIFLLQNDKSISLNTLKIGFSSVKMDFLTAVFPGEKVTVTSKKIYFRFYKLRCEVRMFNSSGQLICKGILDGMVSAEKK